MADDLIRRSQIPILPLRSDEASLDSDQPDVADPDSARRFYAGGGHSEIYPGTRYAQAVYVLLQVDCSAIHLPVGARFPASTERDAAVTESRRAA